MGSWLLTALFYAVVVLILFALIAEFLGTGSGNEAGTAEERPEDKNSGSTDLG